MPGPPTHQTLPPPSALQTLLETHPKPPQFPTDLTNLALQIAHNLKHMHLWTDLRLHTHSPLTSLPLPRPLISGKPPKRLYVHPDEQIELLQLQKQKQRDEGGEGSTGMPYLEPQREWVLPSHLREKWSLRKFGEVFDGIGVVPSVKEGERLFDSARGSVSEDKDEEEVEEEDVVNAWRTDMAKRLLLATLDDDSTVVYYIVHDGIVKPRQN